MLSAQLPWRQAEQQMDHLFPDLDPGLVAVIDGDTPEAATAPERRLVESAAALSRSCFQSLRIRTEPYFRRKRLLLWIPANCRKWPIA